MRLDYPRGGTKILAYRSTCSDCSCRTLPFSACQGTNRRISASLTLEDPRTPKVRLEYPEGFISSAKKPAKPCDGPEERLPFSACLRCSLQVQPHSSSRLRQRSYSASYILKDGSCPSYNAAPRTTALWWSDLTIGCIMSRPLARTSASCTLIRPGPPGRQLRSRKRPIWSIKVHWS